MARALMMSKLISEGSVACNSTWIPSSSLLNLSLELAYSILLLTLELSEEEEKEEEQVPGDEEDLALVAVLVGDEVEVVDGVAALFGGEGGAEVVVGLLREADPLYRHLLDPLLDLEHYEPVVPLRLQLQELELALVVHRHPRRRVRLRRPQEKRDRTTRSSC
ncbi:unnamed protein product [Spirodela intermedia]|uniref:Uncharacterized protein n=1 Tax=Spirodela intermedia TaxID=51605 RepID=A0A7I8JFC5_SPIIN|nr:unnamed protein product [Spirodela intermedia]CAA6668856.1 unnamed protein product [Spirodela intermedia]